MSQNEIDCDCDIKGIKKWKELMASYGTTVNINDLVCANDAQQRQFTSAPDSVFGTCRGKP